MPEEEVDTKITRRNDIMLSLRTYIGMSAVASSSGRRGEIIIIVVVVIISVTGHTTRPSRRRYNSNGRIPHARGIIICTLL